MNLIVALLAALAAQTDAATTDFTFRETLDFDTIGRFGNEVDVEGLRLIACGHSGADAGAAVYESLDGLVFTEVDDFVAADFVSGDGFGQVCSLSGDIAAVGAVFQASNRGAVYMFKTTDGVNWVEKDKLLPSFASSGDLVGNLEGVSLSGMRVAISSIEDNTSGFSRSGSVAIFESVDDGENWVETKVLTSSSPQGNGFFCRVVLKGDRLAVGAFGEDKVHVHTTTDGGVTWPERQILTAAGVSAGYFGASVAMDGDYIFVGDNGYSSERGFGAVYSTDDDGVTWSHVTNVFHSSPAAGDNCGTYAAIHNHIAVLGCRRDANDGMAVVFESTDGGTVWSETYKLSAPSGGATPRFGSYGLSVYNGFLAVGASTATVGTLQGAVYTYGVATAGAGGDPEVVDFAGHRFLAGRRAGEDLVLYTSKAATIQATTSSVRGAHHGYFLESATVVSHGCGESVTLRAAESLSLVVEGGACARSLVALGDNGLGLVVLDTETQTMLAIKAHVSNGFSFVNVHLMGVNTEFRQRCDSGLLCDEAHQFAL